MRKLLFVCLSLPLAGLSSTSCRMAPSENPGDTVAAKYFEPLDTAVRTSSQPEKASALAVDSPGIYVIGPASTATKIQLLSYPSLRDTLVYNKSKHIKVKGNADYGHLVRPLFKGSAKGDTLVYHLEEIKDLPGVKDTLPKGEGIK